MSLQHSTVWVAGFEKISFFSPPFQVPSSINHYYQAQMKTLNPFPAFRMSYEVCGKVHSVQSVRCYWMLDANFLRKFQLSVHSEVKLSFEDEQSWFFNMSLRLLLDENSTSRVNGLAGKGLNK